MKTTSAIVAALLVGATLIAKDGDKARAPDKWFMVVGQAIHCNAAVPLETAAEIGRTLGPRAQELFVASFDSHQLQLADRLYRNHLVVTMEDGSEHWWREESNAPFVLPGVKLCSDVAMFGGKKYNVGFYRRNRRRDPAERTWAALSGSDDDLKHATWHYFVDMGTFEEMRRADSEGVRVLGQRAVR